MPDTDHDHERDAVTTLTAMARDERYDFPGRVAHILAAVAAELGSSDALIASRPGSWEASLIDQLVKGTVGWDDEDLAHHKLPAPGEDN